MWVDRAACQYANRFIAAFTGVDRYVLDHLLEANGLVFKLVWSCRMEELEQFDTLVRTVTIKHSRDGNDDALPVVHAAAMTPGRSADAQPTGSNGA